MPDYPGGSHVTTEGMQEDETWRGCDNRSRETSEGGGGGHETRDADGLWEMEKAGGRAPLERPGRTHLDLRTSGTRRESVCFAPGS